jgi:hypothetical protein
LSEQPRRRRQVACLRRRNGLYAFGFGLSYTPFVYDNFKVLAKKLGANDALVMSVEVGNGGVRGGYGVVQVYVQQQKCGVRQPVEQFRAFRPVHLAAGQKQTVPLSLPVKAWAYWDTKQGSAESRFSETLRYPLESLIGGEAVRTLYWTLQIFPCARPSVVDALVEQNAEIPPAGLFHGVLEVA